MTLGALYREIRQKFRDAGLDTPELDARRIMSYALGCAPDDPILKPDMQAASNASLDSAIARRLAHEPVSRIIGMRGFYGHDFIVTPDVLDPRADTETLVDAARRHLEKYAAKPCAILDVCTGTGCIPLSLISLFPHAHALGVDISAAALDVARQNAKRMGLDNRSEWRISDWVSGVEGTFDVITCNPPYIPAKDIASLAPDVRNYDPLLALDGGDDGLVPYRILFPQIRKFLRENGAAFFEIGINQSADVRKIAVDCGLQVSAVIPDLGGVERVVCVHN